MSDQFRTFQTVQRYEDALSRHGQWLRWVQAVKCSCIDSDTMQPDPQCSVCAGRGRIFRNPDKFAVLQERVRHDGKGKVYPKYVPVVGTPKIYYKTDLLPLDPVQPADGSYVQLAPPYPKLYRILTADYLFSPLVTVLSENSKVYAENILRVIAARFDERGKSFEGSVETVSRVYNSTKDETYTVVSATKEYITLQNMGTWETGDILEVDYTYVKPFNFLLSGVSGRIRYEQPYVLEDADAILVTPYWAQPSPDDVLTALSQEQIASVVVEPSITAGNDVVSAYYDLSRLLRVIDRSGQDYSVGPGNNVEIFGRNELKWNITKPAIPYTVQFTYHPTYTALPNLHTLRNAENKSFVNRVSVKLFDRLHDKVVY